GVGPNREARIMMLAIPGNANFSNGTFTPPTPFPLDNGPITNDEGGVFNLTSGFQLMPAMTFNQGKLMVLYYDLRQDHTIGEFKPPNLPMFIHGTGAFMGDYLGISGQPFVLVKCGNSQCWTYNNPSPPGVAGTFLAAPKPAPTSAVHYASWTSNQDVIPPIDNDWTKYTAIGSGTSVYDRSTTLSCTPGYDGTRNQNVYSS